MSNNVHPEILDGLDYENQFIQRTSGAQRRNVKLNRGDAWLLRFIPAQLGPNGRWYARVAKHWVNQRAIVCPRHTEEAYGGDPDAYCSVCELATHLNDERNEDVSKFGFKLRANANWITYCVVFEKAVQGGQAQVMPWTEVLQPYEFAHYKTTWEELTGFVKAGVRRTPNSVLDFEKGNDFYVSKIAKGGLRLDKQDSTPIFEPTDPKFDEYCQKLIAACKDPVVKIPDEQAMDTFADKAQEEANNIARGTGGGGARGGRGAPAPTRDQDDLPPENEAPARGGRHYSEPAQDAPAPRGRTAAAPPAEAPPARRAPAPTQEAAPRRSAPAPAPAARTAAAPARTAAAAPARRAAPAPPLEPEPEQPEVGQEGQPPDEGDPGAEGDQPPDDGGQPPEEPPPAPVARPLASRPSASRTATAAAAPARTAAAAAATPARSATRGAPVAQESIDENEHIPEEARDQAPPAPLVDPADDPGAGEAPPPVEQTRRGQFASNIRGRIAAVNASAKK